MGIKLPFTTFYCLLDYLLVGNISITIKMSSRFFGSESESSSSESEEEIIERQPQNMFMQSDDEEDVKRVVRTAKEKRFEELNNNIKKIKNYQKNNDINNLFLSYNALEKAFIKSKPVIENQEKGVIPRFFIRCIVELQDYVCKLKEDKDALKKMNKINTKSFNSGYRDLKKFIANEELEAALTAFREDPDADEKKKEDEDSERGSDSDSDSDGDMDFRKESFKKESSVVSESRSDQTSAGGPVKDFDSDFSDEWDSSESSSSS